MNNINKKRGRKPATGDFNKLKDKKLGELSYDDCMSLTLKDIRQLKAYQELTPSANTKMRKSGKGVYRFGCKSTASKHKLCLFLSNPETYYEIVKEANEKKTPEDRKLYKLRDRTGQRIGLCVPKIRLPSDDGECDKHPDYIFKGLTTTGEKCCFKRKQSDKIRKEREERKNDDIAMVPDNKQLLAEIKKFLKRFPNAEKINLYKYLQATVFKINLNSKRTYIYRQYDKLKK